MGFKRVVAVLCAAAMVAVGGCKRENRYSQESPDDVIKSAVAMIRNNEAQKLGRLFYAESPEMRQMLDKLGQLLGHMQQLSIAAQTRFPGEFKAMEEAAAKKAAEGKSGGLFAALAGGQGGPGGARRGGQQVELNENDFREVVNKLFADPYGWVEKNSTRLTTMKVSDDMATVLLDDQPVIPVVGLPMKMEDERWYVLLPTNVPGVSDYMPRTRQQWSIIKSILQVMDNAVIEMTEDVNQGRARSIDSLADKAQDKMIFPGAIAFAAYNKEMEVRGRVERRMKQYTTKQRDWTKAKKEAAPEGTKAVVSDRLLASMTRVAGIEIEEAVRKQKQLGLDTLTDPQFEELAGGWLTKNGLNVRLDGELSGAAVDAAVESWNKARAAALAKKK